MEYKSQDPALNGASVVSNPQVRTPVMLPLLLFIRN